MSACGASARCLLPIRVRTFEHVIVLCCVYQTVCSNLWPVLLQQAHAYMHISVSAHARVCFSTRTCMLSRGLMRLHHLYDSTTTPRLCNRGPFLFQQVHAYTSTVCSSNCKCTVILLPHVYMLQQRLFMCVHTAPPTQWRRRGMRDWNR